MKKRGRRPANLDRWIKTATTPIFALDRRRRIVFLNEGIEQFLGWSSDELMGRVCDFDSDHESPIESITGALCPPAEVLAGNPVSMHCQIEKRSGSPCECTIHYFPITDSDHTTTAVLGVITDRTSAAKSPPISATQRLHAELAALRLQIRQRFQLTSLIAQCPAMQRVLHQIDAAQRAQSSVLLCGEPGTGKEHIARLIHHAAKERRGAFVPFDCRRLSPAELKQSFRRILESESTETQPLAPRSVYLMNVEHLPRDVQQLLIDSPEMSQLQIFSATTHDSLDGFVHDGAMLPGFFFQLTSITIRLPPLRQRREELDLLAQNFLEACNRNQDKQVSGCDQATLASLHEYNWPGNLDELQQVIQEAWATCQSECISPDDLPFRFRSGIDHQSVSPRIEPQSYSLEDRLAEIESELIRDMLEKCHDNKSLAAEKLGLTRARLYRRIEALALDDRSGTRQG